MMMRRNPIENEDEDSDSESWFWILNPDDVYVWSYTFFLGGGPDGLPPKITFTPFPIP